MLKCVLYINQQEEEIKSAEEARHLKHVPASELVGVQLMPWERDIIWEEGEDGKKKVPKPCIIIYEQREDGTDVVLVETTEGERCLWVFSSLSFFFIFHLFIFSLFHFSLLFMLNWIFTDMK